MLKKIENMNEKQKQKFDEINAANLKTAKAWRMRENFMGIYQTQNSSYAGYYFDRWYKSVIHSNLPAMKKVAGTLKSHLEGIINTVDSNISNGKAEQINAKIQKLQSVGHGYRNFDNFRVAILFFNGHLDMFSHSLR
jgi:transposase